MLIIPEYISKIVSDNSSWIIPIFCVFLGAFLETIRRYHDEKKKHEKEAEQQKQEYERQKLESEKHEAELNKIKGLIKSEIELNVKNLKKYNEIYLKMSISRIPSSKERNEIYLDFYKNLNSFPIFCNETLTQHSNVVNEIFIEDQINNINEFNLKCNMIKEKSVKLYEKSKDKEFVNKILQDEYGNEINEAYKDILYFEGAISDLIRDGDSILHFISL